MYGGWAPPGEIATVYPRGARPSRALAAYEAREEEHHIPDAWDRAYDTAADARLAAWQASPFAKGFEQCCAGYRKDV